MKSFERTVKVFELNYGHETWYAEIVKTPQDPDDLFEIWIYPKNYGVKEMIVGEFRYGRSDDEIYDELIDYLYISWENPEDHVWRNSFDNFMMDHPEDFDVQ